LKLGSDGPLLNELVYAKQTDAAVKLFRSMLSRRQLPMFQANRLAV